MDGEEETVQKYYKNKHPRERKKTKEKQIKVSNSRKCDAKENSVNLAVKERCRERKLGNVGEPGGDTWNCLQANRDINSQS
jgi:hypothetical protein